MLYIHPALQILAMSLIVYALVLAWPRIVTLHLGNKRIFNRRRHVLVGETALGLMLAGMLGGAVMARLYWRGWFITGDHAWLALAMLPFLLFGLGSGLYLARAPRMRRLLPALHGLNNLILLVLAFFQANEGREVVEHFIRGG